jgi:hypothetical protein
VLLLIRVRLILALAVFAASLGVATSWRLSGPRDARLAAGGTDPELQLEVIVDAAVRWSSVAHKKRSAPTPGGLRPALLTLPTAVPRPAGWVATVRFAVAVQSGRAASFPASPRAPPRSPFLS